MQIMKKSNLEEAEALFAQARMDIAADMKSRGIGAIIWDTTSTQFHYLPVISLDKNTGERENVNIMGIYRVGEALFLIEQGKADVSISNYYEAGVEERPVVVTLTEAQAEQQLGSPNPERGFTADGGVEEWLTVADCYFEALTLNNDV